MMCWLRRLRFTCAASLTFDAFIKFVFQTPADGDPMVFVGDRQDEEARRIHDRLLGPQRMRNTKWVHLPRRGEAHGVTPAKAIERVHDALTTENADTLVLCGEYDTTIFEAIVESATAAGIRVLAVPRVSGVMQEHPGLVWYGGTPFVELTVPGLRGWLRGDAVLWDKTVHRTHPAHGVLPVRLQGAQA